MVGSNDSVPSGAIMWLFVATKDQNGVQIDAPTNLAGNVKFDENDPDESGSQTWPLSNDWCYRIFLLRDTIAPYTAYTAIAVSSEFHVVQNPPSV